jgi:alanine or glycine:cation symporter, AGCS family
MKKNILFTLATLLSFSLQAQEVAEASLDERINAFFESATGWYVNFLFGSFSVPIFGVQFPIIVIWLIVGALFCTFYFSFVNIRHFKTSIDIIRGRYDEKPPQVEKGLVHTINGDIKGTIKDESIKGEVSHFQALTAAISGTVGLGNIAGVAVAISIGGPGATFWMIIAGFIGMASKFTECTLGVKYREIGPDGKVYGGPMYYLSKGLKEKGFTKLGKVLAVLFAVLCIGGSFGGGNMFQSNQAYAMFKNTFLDAANPVIPGWLFGLILAAFVAVVIIGGIKSIAKVTDKVVPFMVAIYVLASLFIIISHYQFIPAAFSEIMRGAMKPLGIAGGAVGVIFQGFKRAAFSNEAGVGSASIAHSAVKTNDPASEGLVALMEPFIDTIVICTMTCLLIVISNMDGSILQYGGNISFDEGVVVTSNAFAQTISWFPYILSVAVILFAFSTMISWSYYGIQSWTYLFGKSKANEIIYKAIFCIFIIIGASSSLGAVIDFSDAMILSMAFPNFIGLVILAPVVKKELSNYLAKIKKM